MSHWASVFWLTSDTTLTKPTKLVWHMFSGLAHGDTASVVSLHEVTMQWAVPWLGISIELCIRWRCDVIVALRCMLTHWNTEKRNFCTNYITLYRIINIIYPTIRIVNNFVRIKSSEVLKFAIVLTNYKPIDSWYSRFDGAAPVLQERSLPVRTTPRSSLPQVSHLYWRPRPVRHDVTASRMRTWSLRHRSSAGVQWQGVTAALWRHDV